MPVFSRPHRNPSAFSDSARSRDGGSPARPAGRCSGPTWISPLRNVPVVTTSARQSRTLPSSSSSPCTRPASDEDPVAGLSKIQSISGTALERSRTHVAVAPLVRLRPRRPHGRAAAAVQQLELDAGRVDGLAHQAAERIDFAHQVTLGRAADRRIAGHVPDGAVRQRADRDRAAKPRRGPRGLDARVTGADTTTS